MKTILALIYMFNVSTMPFYYVGFNNEYIHFENSNSVNFMLGIDVYDVFTFYGGEDTKQNKENLFNWYPYNQEYYVGGFFHYDFNESLKLKLGIDRRCSHPLNCWDRQDCDFNSASCSIYLTVEGKIPLL